MLARVGRALPAPGHLCCSAHWISVRRRHTRVPAWLPAAQHILARPDHCRRHLSHLRPPTRVPPPRAAAHSLPPAPPPPLFPGLNCRPTRH